MADAKEAVLSGKCMRYARGATDPGSERFGGLCSDKNNRQPIFIYSFQLKITLCEKETISVLNQSATMINHTLKGQSYKPINALLGNGMEETGCDN